MQWKIDYLRHLLMPKNRAIPIAASQVMGLKNLGNTCYMNCALQALLQSEFLEQFFAEYKMQTKPEIQSSKQAYSVFRFVASFSQLYKAKDRYSQYSPISLLLELESANSDFVGRKQQDTQEFLSFLLNSVADETRQYQFRGVDVSPISDCFKGQGVYSLQCLKCGLQAENGEEFFTLSLDIPAADQLTRVSAKSRLLLTKSELERNNELTESLWNRFRGIFSSSGSAVITLYDCLVSCTWPEVLQDSESRFCDVCGERTKCEKVFKLTTTPNSLIVHLKRFKYSFFGSKIDSFVQYPPELQLNDFTVHGVESMYDLYALIVHSGRGISRGHYTTYCKVREGWILFDDAKVKSVTVEEAMNQEAYLLFYRQRGEERPIFPPPEGAETCFVLKYWIQKYEKLANPGPLVQSHAICPHGKLSLRMEKSQLKEVSVSFWEYMLSKVGITQFQGDEQPLRTAEECTQCKKRAELISRRMALEGIFFENLRSRKREGPWFILPKKWQIKWKSFVLTQKVVPELVSLPGKIDTESLLEGARPRPGLIIGRDYTFVSQITWQALKELYECGPDIRRDKGDIYDKDVPAPTHPVSLFTAEDRADLQELKSIDLS